MSPAMVNRKLACLKHMYTKATEWGYLSVNPVKSVESLITECLNLAMTHEFCLMRADDLVDRVRRASAKSVGQNLLRMLFEV